MISKHILWLTPFICFLSGYILVRSLFHIDTVSTPSVVGKHVYEAFALLSNNNLNIRLLAQKEDPDLPSGTVISQLPSPGQIVKPRQTVFLALSKQPISAPTPQLIGKDLQTITQELLNAKLRFKTYFLQSPYPHNSCIAQIPAAHKPITDTIIVYLSSGNSKPIIWPNFEDKPVDEVVEFLAQYNIIPHIIQDRHSRKSENSTITDQRPLAGSLISIDPNHPPIVQLHVI